MSGIPTNIPTAAPPAVARVLAQLKERLRPLFGGRLVEMRLFGSFARGEANAESDVDVLILLDGDLHANENEALFREIAEVDRDARVWISPLVFSRARYRRMVEDEVGIALDIEAEGIVV
jgi:predicted nucleotidyltransferase